MADFTSFGTTATFGIAALPGSDQGVLRFAALDQDQTVLLKPDIGATGTIDTWTLGFDILVPPGQGTWTSFLQTDLSNTSDGELFIRASNATEGSIGISSSYQGSFQYGTWERVVFTAERSGNTTTLNKYIDGTLAGTQSLTGTRWTLDADDGFLLVSDNDGDVSSGFLSSVLFSPTALTTAQVAALGAPDADGFYTAAPATGATQFDFSDGTYAATFGPGDLTAPGDTDPPAVPDLAVANRISDVMTTPGSTVTIDLSDVFNRDDITLSIDNDDLSVVTDAVMDGDTLTLTFGALGHADLRLTATDLDGNTAVDNFRVRAAGPNAYTIAVLPDTQDYTDSSLSNGPPQTFYNMTQWLVDNKASHNIVFVAHVGDVTQNNLDYEWVVANTALSKLDGVIPYSLLPGNHDQAAGGSAADHSSVFLDSIFSPTRQAASNPTTFGGVYDQEPDRGVNNYHTFEAPDGTDWLVLSMEFGPRDDVIRWGSEVIEAHLDHKVIIVSHSLTDYAGRHDPAGGPLYDEGAGYDYGMGRDPEGANDGETVFRELSAKYGNVAFTFSGHIFGDGAETNVSYSQNGNAIIESLVNYQNGISREITGNGNEALGSRGGNGAMRLVVVDPDNDTYSTETYFTEFDDYLDGFRVKPEIDRDGLTGLYRGHEETFENAGVGTPDLRAIAKAGDDQFVAAPAGATTLAVTLDGTRTLDPAADIATYDWVNADGDVVATGETASVDLALGRHDLTLVVTDTQGRETTDAVTVIVSGDGTRLVETFNDGTLDGWSIPSAGFDLAVGTPESFGLPALPGTGSESVLEVPALSQTQGLLLSPNFGAPVGTLIGDYSLVFDIYVPDGQGTWTSFIQTNVNNTDDGELFIRSNGDGTGGIGISGDYTGSFQYDTWQRVVFVFDDNNNGTSNLKKYIDGVLVGEQTVTGDRFKLDVGRGALLFGDESDETSDIFVSSLVVTDKVFTTDEIAALGGAQAGGILAAPPTAGSAQFDFDTADLAATFGVPSLSFGPVGTGGGSNFLLKGSVFSRDTAVPGQAAPEARLYDQSDRPDNILLWNDPAALEWTDYTLEATIRSTDNDTIGLAFLYQDRDNHYRVTLDSETNTRELVQVVGGVATVLASEIGGSRFNTDQQLKVAVIDGTAHAFLDGAALFGGAVAGIDPTAAGTVGLYSSNQRSSQFDTITVNDTRLTAHAGDDARSLDRGGDGAETVTLSAGASFGPAAITSWLWTDALGNVRGTDETITIDLAVGTHKLTLTVTDANGATATDRVNVEVVGQDRVWLAEDFSAATLPAGWTIVDEGEFGGAGPDGTASDWTISNGALTQNSDLQSRQLEWDGATNPDYWQRGWSPLGDGVNVLRVGTYALYTGAGSQDWQNYSLQASITTPDNDGLGFLIHYVDAHNYYKLELDSEGTYDRDPSNGAGSLFNLVRMRDGIEEILGQVPQRYTPGEAFDLRVDIVDGKMTAWINRDEIFAYAIEDRAHEKGTVGLYSWGNAGLAFDDVTVVGLDAMAQAIVEPGVHFLQGTTAILSGNLPAQPPADPGLVAASVAIDTGATVGGSAFTLVENTGVWNAIKSAVFGPADYLPSMGTAFAVANFVDVRLNLSDALDQADLLVVGAKRGSLVGSDFADVIRFVAHSNAAPWWSDLVAIDGGAGDDVIEIRAVVSSDFDNALLADNAAPRNGGLWNRLYDGRATLAEVKGGDGSDTIRGFDRVALNAEGGAGNDVGQGGDAVDTWLLAGLRGGYALTATGTGWTIEDIDLADGDTGTDTIVGFELIRFADGSLLAL